jgi:uncharacterized protein (TIGR03000 family)
MVRSLSKLVLAALLVCAAASRAPAVGGGHGGGGHGGGAGHVAGFHGGYGYGHGGYGYGHGFYGRPYGYYGYPYGYYGGFGVGIGFGYGYGFGSPFVYGYGGFPYYGLGYPGGGYYGGSYYTLGGGYPFYTTAPFPGGGYPTYFPYSAGPPDPAAGNAGQMLSGGLPALQPPDAVAAGPGGSAAPAPLTAADTEAALVVRVPASATVWVNGAKTSQSGPRREFVSSNMNPGRSYTYLVRARWVEPSGLVEDHDRAITVRAGERRALEFGSPPRPGGPAAPIPPAVSATPTLAPPSP